VASSQVKNTSGYWPPALPDAVETIAASYVQTQSTSKVRLFNLSPDTKAAGMQCSTNGSKALASGTVYIFAILGKMPIAMCIEPHLLLQSVDGRISA
jgi:hypothetical protein